MPPRAAARGRARPRTAARRRARPRTAARRRARPRAAARGRARRRQGGTGGSAESAGSRTKLSSALVRLQVVKCRKCQLRLNAREGQYF
ncbi:hypothetical protein chiPu_0023133 [Chiloscyllium punctatum]|uniref:Uncharacterized protein n=1 Tax=Chiloscyllium punctatum TaxID=137246 RepID=A0A401T976_CHIPU|nr:hypothetical protein [Chiloscyllium punctatum]